MTTLHVIHHGCMPMSVWFGVRFTPGGHSTFFGLLNTFVHIIMYTYYMFSAMGPQYQKYLWWKKYLTTLQMVCPTHLSSLLPSLCISIFKDYYLCCCCFGCFLGAIYSNHGARLPIALHRMQLSQGLCLVDWNACRYVLLLVQWILQTGVQRTTAGEWSEKGEEKRDISSR